jgi:hypothetical protein
MLTAADRHVHYLNELSARRFDKHGSIVTVLGRGRLKHTLHCFAASMSESAQGVYRADQMLDSG